MSGTMGFLVRRYNGEEIFTTRPHRGMYVWVNDDYYAVIHVGHSRAGVVYVHYMYEGKECNTPPNAQLVENMETDD